MIVPKYIYGIFFHSLLTDQILMFQFIVCCCFDAYENQYKCCCDVNVALHSVSLLEMSFFNMPINVRSMKTLSWLYV